jgi:molecular chaperone GrpE
MEDKQEKENKEESNQEACEGVEPEAPQSEEEVTKRLESELEESKNETLRLHAEFQNFKNRMEKEKSAAVAYAHEAIAKDLLAVMDTFDQALVSMQSDEESEALSSIKEGVELTYEQLKKALAKHGIEEIGFEEGYDPNYHQAIMQVDSDEHESGDVVQVLQKGYTIKERVLRPAMVSTCK